jgi:UDP-glucose:(heptosyl)LPS alpha-1,3-glucosyltransferase
MRARGRESLTGSVRNWGITDAFFLRCEKKNFAEHKYRRIITVAEGIRRELFECYGVPEDHVVVIPNGVDLHAFSPEVKTVRRDQTRRRMGLALNDEVILFAGNEFERKGLRFALDALAIVRASSRKLLVVGNDDPVVYRKYAESRGIASNVVFTGVVDDMPSVYAAADLFLLPTSYEAFPLVLLEAAATGLPILITRVHGAEEFIRERENGLFITQDPLDIAQAIQVVLGNLELRERLGHAARTAVLQYSWDLIAEKTRNVYRNVFDQKQKKSK